MGKYHVNGIDYECYDLEYFDKNASFNSEHFHCNPPKDPSIYHYRVECFICSKLIIRCLCKECKQNEIKIICNDCIKSNDIKIILEGLNNRVLNI